MEELVGGENQGPEASPRSKIGRDRKEQRRYQGRSDCQWSDVKGGCVWVIEGEEVIGDDPVEYFLPTGVGSTS